MCPGSNVALLYVQYLLAPCSVVLTVLNNTCGVYFLVPVGSDAIFLQCGYSHLQKLAVIVHTHC